MLSVIRMVAMVVVALALLTLAPFGDHAAAIEAPDDDAATIAVEAATTQPPNTQPPNTQPPISANEFIPDDRDLTSCIGVLERPGCGSESRGGWRQTLVFGALFVGLVFIFGNVARGVRKRDR